jgi:3-hydroxyacyl-CoA dehydrogenase
VRVAVVGAGLMGAQIGVEYALGGHDVALYARDVGRVTERVDAAWSLLSTHGLRTPAEIAESSSRVATATTPDGAARDADLIVESLPEDLDLKSTVLRAAVGAARPEAVVASNTSSLSITHLGTAIGVAERTVGTHYLNPPLLMPPVEIVAGEETSAGTVAFAHDTVAALGKRPILVRRDVPGFVWNRLQFALVRECAWLVENGVASPDDVDAVVREGLARRWRHVGPLRAIALGGVETWNRSGRNIVPALSTASDLPDLVEVAITDGDLDVDAAARDKALAGELRRPRTTGEES